MRQRLGLSCSQAANSMGSHSQRSFHTASTSQLEVCAISVIAGKIALCEPFLPEIDVWAAYVLWHEPSTRRPWLQDLCVGDVKQLLDLYKQMVPAGLKAALLSEQADASVPLHKVMSNAPMTGRFTHFGLEDLRLVDVPELHSDFHTLLSLQQ